MLALILIAITISLILITRHLVHQARERKADDEAAAEWFRMAMRNGGLLTSACQEMWGKLLEAWMKDMGGYDAQAAQLLEEFVVRCRALVKQRTSKDPLVYLAWTTREELIATRDLRVELYRRGIRLTTPHGEAADGRRLLYATVRLPRPAAVGGLQVQPLQTAERTSN